MTGRKFVILLIVVFFLSAGYYFYSTDRSSDLVLIGTVDSNQVIVSPKIQGRIEKLNVDEGTQVKQGDLIAVLDSAELEADKEAAAATISSMQSKVSETRATEEATKGSTSSDVASFESRVQSVKAQLVQAQANLERTRLDTERSVSLADQGVASQQEKDRALAQLKADQAAVRSLQDQVQSAQADLQNAIARTHQAHAAQSTVASTRAQVENAKAMLAQADTRLGYTRIYAPVSGTVSVRAVREGEVVQPGQAMVTIIDLSDTWVRAPIPETQADNIRLGDSLKVRLPSGRLMQGKVIFKAVESDFATQRDVSRRKRDIKTLLLKVQVQNNKAELVPGETAEVLIPQSKLKASSQNVLSEQR